MARGRKPELCSSTFFRATDGSPCVLYYIYSIPNRTTILHKHRTAVLGDEQKEGVRRLQRVHFFSSESNPCNAQRETPRWGSARMVRSHASHTIYCDVRENNGGGAGEPSVCVCRRRLEWTERKPRRAGKHRNCSTAPDAPLPLFNTSKKKCCVCVCVCVCECVCLCTR